MSATSRVLSVLAIGVGAGVAVWGIVAPSFMHDDGRLPLDTPDVTLRVFDEDATVRTFSAEGERVLRTEVTRQHHISLMEPADADTVTLRIGATLTHGEAANVDVADDIDRLVDAAVWSYRIDRSTGLATEQASVTALPVGSPAEVDVEGQWLKFPANVEKKSYDVFDDRLRAALPAEFVDAESIDGRNVYRFRQTIEPTNVAENYASPFNTKMVAVADTPPKSGYLFHSGTREFLVDQETGLVVGVEEHVDDFYGTAEGDRLETALKFNGTTPAEDTSKLLDIAADMPEKHTQTTRSLIMIIAGVLLAIAGMIGLYVARARREKPQPATTEY